MYSMGPPPMPGQYQTITSTNDVSMASEYWFDSLFSLPRPRFLQKKAFLQFSLLVFFAQVSSTHECLQRETNILVDLVLFLRCFPPFVCVRVSLTGALPKLLMWTFFSFDYPCKQRDVISSTSDHWTGFSSFFLSDINVRCHTLSLLLSSSTVVSNKDSQL